KHQSLDVVGVLHRIQQGTESTQRDADQPDRPMPGRPSRRDDVLVQSLEDVRVKVVTACTSTTTISAGRLLAQTAAMNRFRSKSSRTSPTPGMKIISSEAPSSPQSKRCTASGAVAGKMRLNAE